jgi:hypothetical protein
VLFRQAKKHGVPFSFPQLLEQIRNVLLIATNAHGPEAKAMLVASAMKLATTDDPPDWLAVPPSPGKC